MISIAISDLKPALAGLAKVISSKSSLECLRSIRVDATPERTTLKGTDLDIFASVALPGAYTETSASFLLPLDRLQSMARRLPPRSFLYLEEGKIACDLGTGRVSEDFECLKVEEFPEELAVEAAPVPMPETFARRFAEAMGCSSTDATRYILNGIQLDVGGPKDAGHYLVGTDGRHLFSANSFTLPIPESVIIPSHKLLLWRGLSDLPWALAGQKNKSKTLVRIVAGNWTLTLKTIEGNYPNWRQVVPKGGDIRTTVALPEGHGFAKLVAGLPGEDTNNKPVDLVIENGAVAVKDTSGASSIALAGAKAKGPDIKIRLNRDYLAKAFDYGLTSIGIIDPMSALQFTREGRQMVVMPLRVADVARASRPAPQEHAAPTNQPAPSEPQPVGAAAPGHRLDEIRYGQGRVERRCRRSVLVLQRHRGCQAGGRSRHRAHRSHVPDHALNRASSKKSACTRGRLFFTYQRNRLLASGVRSAAARPRRSGMRISR
jgi:DNA polymerase III sliding clamp (beta) subunit (PCNA family)